MSAEGDCCKCERQRQEKRETVINTRERDVAIDVSVHQQVWECGFMVYGFGFMVYGSGFRVYISGFRVWS